MRGWSRSATCCQVGGVEKLTFSFLLFAARERFLLFAMSVVEKLDRTLHPRGHSFGSVRTIRDKNKKCLLLLSQSDKFSSMPIGATGVPVMTDTSAEVMLEYQCPACCVGVSSIAGFVTP